MDRHIALHQPITIVPNFLDERTFVLRSHHTGNGVFLTEALIAIIVLGMVEGTLEGFGIHRGIGVLRTGLYNP